MYIYALIYFILPQIIRGKIKVSKQLVTLIKAKLEKILLTNIGIIKNKKKYNIDRNFAIWIFAKDLNILKQL